MSNTRTHVIFQYDWTPDSAISGFRRPSPRLARRLISAKSSPSGFRPVFFAARIASWNSLSAKSSIVARTCDSFAASRSIKSDPIRQLRLPLGPSLVRCDWSAGDPAGRNRAQRERRAGSASPERLLVAAWLPETLRDCVSPVARPCSSSADRSPARDTRLSQPGGYCRAARITSQDGIPDNRNESRSVNSAEHIQRT